MKSFTVQPFGQRIHVTADAAEFVRRHNRHAPEAERTTLQEIAGCAGMASHFEVHGDDAVFLLYMREDYDADTLYHESLHLAHFVMHFCNVPISVESTETQAYLMGDIATRAAEKIKPTSKKRVKP